MKLLVAILLCCCSFAYAQRTYTLIDTQTKQKYIKKDSISATKFLDSLASHRYFHTKLVGTEEQEGNINIFFDKGKDFQKVKVHFSDSIISDLKLKNDHSIKDLDSVRRFINESYRAKGFTFNRVKTKFLGLDKDHQPKVRISVELMDKRLINGFTIRGYERVPERFVKNLNKNFTGKIYDDKNLMNIYNQLKNHPFVSLEKFPQTLFTKDSTQIFLFLQKKKANSFDGVLGFGNNESEKLGLNGSLNLNFKNIFNSFESINIFWQRNQNKGQDFDLQADVPYLFKSNLGANMQVKIFRQDSTFANVKLLPSVYYHISSKQKLGMRGNFEMASKLSETLSTAQNFQRKGLGLWYEYNEMSEVEIMPYKAKIRAEADVFKTLYDTDLSQETQKRYFLFGEYNYHLTGNHFINIKGESAFIDSEKVLFINELLRFGGWNSFRGFNENSLFANFYAFGGLEYRYLIGKQAFFDIFMQMAQLENKSLNAKPKLYSVGLGFNFTLPIGVMSFQISNGNQFGNEFRFKETKIHWGIVTRF